MTKLATCSHCGSPVVLGDAVCGSCGSRLVWRPTASMVQTASGSTPEQQTAVEPVPKRRRLWVPLAVLCGVAAGVIVVVVFLGRTAQEDSPIEAPGGIVLSQTCMNQANGITVHDLGRDVANEAIIEQALALNADIIGTSALLTTTMVEQKKLEAELKKAGLRDRFKTIVGGAPVTARWAARIGADAYGEDAQDAVKKVSKLLGL